MLKQEQFLPAVTTTDGGTNWREKIAEIDQLGLKRVALFPTCLRKPQREEMFSLLSRTGLEEIPFVHLRTDMDYSEVDWLRNKYRTQVFNFHSTKEHKHFFDYTPYKEIIYLENVYSGNFTEEEIKQWAGICLDFSHLENYRLKNEPQYQFILEMLEKYALGCNHISAIAQEPFVDNKGVLVYGAHHFTNLAEFDYLKNYPLEYFSNFVAIEVDNSLKEQVQVIDYIVNLMN
ncbi:MAG: hypothetical protein NTV62_03785 [Candidatus Gribaldobacteria bacterium]|nr:hypothetical protein [Candidatus Gribaldobacteria bacterium]